MMHLKKRKAKLRCDLAEAQFRPFIPPPFDPNGNITQHCTILKSSSIYLRIKIIVLQIGAFFAKLIGLRYSSRKVLQFTVMQLPLQMVQWRKGVLEQEAFKGCWVALLSRQIIQSIRSRLAHLYQLYERFNALQVFHIAHIHLVFSYKAK